MTRSWHPAIASLPLVSILTTIAVGSQALAQTQPITAAVPVDEFRLANGMKFLLVPRADATTVAAGWMVRTGSADDPPDQTGLAHLMEHMLFKGSRTIGSRNLGQELGLLQREDAIRADLAELRLETAGASPRKQLKIERQIAGIETELAQLQTDATSLVLLGQFSFLYSEFGATGLNANTLPDLTLYYVTLPAEKLEAWFWLESDRLHEPIFREFYKEVQVVHEERRLRLESKPSGSLEEALRQQFWGNHPYSWNSLGAPEDLDGLTRADAEEFFKTHYQPDQITAVLVGAFDNTQIRAWAELYFGRLRARTVPSKRGHTEPAERRSAENRMSGTCECPPQTRILYPSPPFDHADSPALQVLAALMNGRTGRLYRSLVLEDETAYSAFTTQMSWLRAGEFRFEAETKGDVDPQQMVAAWDRQLRLLQNEPITDEELTRSKNRLTADAFRSLKDPSSLMKQLLIYDGLGEWRHINRWPGEILQVAAEDVRRVAARYLLPDHRTVAIYRRSSQADQGLVDSSGEAPTSP